LNYHEINELIIRRPYLAPCKIDIETFCKTVIDCYKNGGKVLVCGNGGSSADAGHIVGELMKGFKKTRPTEVHEKLQTPLRAIDLTAQNTLVTGIANDIGADYIFAQQVLGYADKGDILIAISTSGNSENVNKAVEIAKKLEVTTIAMTNSTGGKLKTLCDIVVYVPEHETYRVQEEHIAIYHAVCLAVEDTLFN